ncbi:molybdate ABC transporter substrate-binding protein [Demequina iriomotensis]|uniref:molybdate ABC transporter substrate-binding protein n=1 Tax=Demequina iriomotensis TaxID=1536641 RepID=UPI000780F471|nr:molybdate ABC transporter substrate-binding protein [Demequina iriomotensis]
MRRGAALAGAAGLTVGLAACAGATGAAGPSATAIGATASGDRTLTVFAAASLTDVLEEIATAFETDHPGLHVLRSYAGSSDLAAQINEGAPADVFLSADQSTMDKIAGAVAGEPTVFATNTLTFVVPAGNPAGIADLASFAKPGVTTVICAPQVPCGAATATLAALGGVTLSPASEEASVTDVLGKVASGQADAGIVYVTDVARAEGVEAVPIARADAVVNRYPAAALAAAADAATAQAFVDYLAGDEARAVLTGAGFGAP